MHTCAYEHDIILAIFCFYFIHHYLGELVVHICFDYDRSIVNGVDRVEHGWVASGEGHNLIRKVLGCIESSKCLAWALQSKKKVCCCNSYIGEHKSELCSVHSSKTFQFSVCCTHSARTWVGNTSLEGHPLIIWSISMGVRTQEHPPDVCHAVHTHS